MNLIKLEKINKTYGKGETKAPALRNINLSIKKGEFVAIMGASGSGKTTLLNIIGLLDRADTGSYNLNDIHINKLKDRQLAAMRRRSIGFVFQNFNLLGRFNARGNVELPMAYNHLKRKERRERSTQLLKLVGLSNRMKHRPGQLSGGQLQRVAIARALANHPALILADEPTGNLDSKTGAIIINILKKLNQRGNTIIVVTHDPVIAARASRRIELKDGQVTFQQPSPARINRRLSVKKPRATKAVAVRKPAKAPSGGKKLS